MPRFPNPNKSAQNWFLATHRVTNNAVEVTREQFLHDMEVDVDWFGLSPKVSNTLTRICEGLGEDTWPTWAVHEVRHDVMNLWLACHSANTAVEGEQAQGANFAQEERDESLAGPRPLQLVDHIRWHFVDVFDTKCKNLWPAQTVDNFEYLQEGLVRHLAKLYTGVYVEGDRNAWLYDYDPSFPDEDIDYMNLSDPGDDEEDYDAYEENFDY